MTDYDPNTDGPVARVECRPCDLDEIPIRLPDLTFWIDQYGRACHVFVCPVCEETRTVEWNPANGRADGAVKELAQQFPGILVIKVASILETESNLLWTEFARVQGDSSRPSGSSA